MNAVQLNTRMSADLRDKGNRAFANVGKTPSEVVRIIWEYAAENIENSENLDKFFETLEEEKLKKDRERRLKAVQEGPKILENFCKEHGIKPNPKYVHMSYKELKEKTFDELLKTKYAG